MRAPIDPESVPISTPTPATTGTTARLAITHAAAIALRTYQGRSRVLWMASNTPMAVESPEDVIQRKPVMLTAPPPTICESRSSSSETSFATSGGAAHGADAAAHRPRPVHWWIRPSTQPAKGGRADQGRGTRSKRHGASRRAALAGDPGRR